MNNSIINQPCLSAFEVSKRLLRFNLSGDHADLGTCHEVDAVRFMYPNVMTISNTPEGRKAELEQLFGPLDETEDQYNERQKYLVNVTVSGSHGTGKSAVSAVIRKALIEAGIITEIRDDNGSGIVDEQPGVVEKTLGSRLDSLAARNTRAVIRTALTTRSH